MEPIRINNFHKGQSSSPYVADGAYAKAANLDVFSQLGIARINYLPTKESGTTITATPTCFAADPANASRLYVADSGGETYVSTDRGDSWAALTANKGQYIVVWKDHLIAVGHTSAINTYGPLSGTPAWLAIGSTTNVADFIFVSENDDKVYILHNNKVDTLEEVAGQDFDDATGGTFTLSAGVLTLPEGYEGICLSEQKENILIGAYSGLSGAKLKKATIFVWDRGTTSYSFPVRIPEPSINAMLNVGNRVYVSTGRDGKIYLFSESGLQLYAQIPQDYDARKDCEVARYGLGWWRGKLIVATKTVNIANSLPTGLYGIRDGAVNCEHLIASGEDGGSDFLEIGAVYSIDTGVDDVLLMGYYDKQSTAYAIDRITDNHNRVASYGAYFESLFYRIGTPTNQESARKIDIQLARPLQTGEGVRISYREDINAAWTTLGTFDYTTYGAHSSFPMNFGKKDIRNLQIKCELTTGATSKNTPYLYELIIY